MSKQSMPRTAADLPKGTRVVSPEGRMGTVNGVDVGRVTEPGHPNYGREYIGVNWDAIEGDMGCNRRSRPFVDELVMVAAAEDTNCKTHGVEDRRGGRALELGTIPACESGITYGAWSEGAGGFVYSGDCATEVANWAAEELRQLAKDDDTDTIEILAMCPDHDEQPKNGCEECGSEGDDADDEHEAEQGPGLSLDDYAKASRIIQSLIPGVRR